MNWEKYDIESCLQQGAAKAEIEGDFLQIMGDLLENLPPSRQKLNRSYLLSYSLFVNYFSDIKNITLSKFTLGIYMIYGWMPTALRFYGGKSLSQEEFVKLRKKLSEMQTWGEDHFDGVLPDGGDASKSDEGIEESLLLLQSVTNGSIVGMSKLLHFINPKLFPIYDSNIAEVVGEVKDVGEYIEYVKAFQFFKNKVLNGCEKGRFEEIREKFESDCRGEFNGQASLVVTPIRAIELVLFQVGKKVKDSKPKPPKGVRGGKK